MMGRVQGSITGKALSTVLLLVMTFLGAFFGVRALTALDYVQADSCQDTALFHLLLQTRQSDLASYFADRERLATEELNYMQRQQLQEAVEALESSMSRDNTYFRFRLRSADGSQVLYSNLREEEQLSELVDKVHYASFQLGEDSVTQDSRWNEDDQSFILWNSLQSSRQDTGGEQVQREEPTVLVIECGLPARLDGQVLDEFSQLEQEYVLAKDSFYGWLATSLICLPLALLCFSYILWTAGHKQGRPDIVLSWQERIYFDLYVLCAAVAIILLTVWTVGLGEELRLDAHSQNTMDRLALVGVSALSALLMGVITLVARTLAVRLKGRALARSTLLCRVLIWLCRVGFDFVRHLPLTWRMAASFLAYTAAGFLVRSIWSYNPLPSILLNTAVLVGVCWWTMCFRRLREGSQAIAAGNMNLQIETARLPYDLRQQAEDLNNISQGLSSAVQEQMKSERFKAELITNVSHDLKTPLTSIINYVNLLKTTQQSDPKAVEYIEVLDRKSQRLKKLTEDLVEASKASTGALSVNREKIGMGQLIDQALGEWEEKLQAKHLQVVTSLPEGETWVYADGRHLWRVIDNLLSNCAKYAMEGTRIYLDLARGKGKVSFSVKNVSRDALNVPPERLMERFVRGEESRTTEGSGLGLSIARSLTELQGGTFQLLVDGDLFKAIVTLPQSG